MRDKICIIHKVFNRKATEIRYNCVRVNNKKKINRGIEINECIN